MVRSSQGENQRMQQQLTSLKSLKPLFEAEDLKRRVTTKEDHLGSPLELDHLNIYRYCLSS